MAKERTNKNKKNGETKDINSTLEEIVQNVTSPSFCVLPWKCVTMAVGGRMDPSIKKSLVHVHRTCVDGQNVFDIKVHNCRKDICDHVICTKDCDTDKNRSLGGIGKESGSTKKKRRKTKKNGERSELTVGYLNPSVDKHKTSNGNESVVKGTDMGDLRKMRHTQGSMFEQSENKEKPSCTLQIFSEGKARKLNFHLHPAMEVFLEKAIDKIEGTTTKKRKKKRPKDLRGSNILIDRGVKYENDKIKVTDSSEEFHMKFSKDNTKPDKVRELSSDRTAFRIKPNKFKIKESWGEPFSCSSNRIPNCNNQQCSIQQRCSVTSHTEVFKHDNSKNGTDSPRISDPVNCQNIRQQPFMQNGISEETGENQKNESHHYHIDYLPVEKPCKRTTAEQNVETSNLFQSKFGKNFTGCCEKMNHRPLLKKNVSANYLQFDEYDRLQYLNGQRQKAKCPHFGYSQNYKQSKKVNSYTQKPRKENFQGPISTDSFVEQHHKDCPIEKHNTFIDSTSMEYTGNHHISHDGRVFLREGFQDYGRKGYRRPKREPVMASENFAKESIAQKKQVPQVTRRNVLRHSNLTPREETERGPYDDGGKGSFELFEEEKSSSSPNNSRTNQNGVRHKNIKVNQIKNGNFRKFTPEKRQCIAEVEINEGRNHLIVEEDQFKEKNDIRPCYCSRRENIDNKDRCSTNDEPHDHISNNEVNPHENRNLLRRNVLYSKKTPKEKRTTFHRTLSVETSDSSDYIPVAEFGNDITGSEKSVEVTNLCYEQPKYYGCYQCVECRDSHEKLGNTKGNYYSSGNREIRNENEIFYKNQEYICYPTQVSWQYENNNTDHSSVKTHKHSRNNDSENDSVYRDENPSFCKVCFNIHKNEMLFDNHENQKDGFAINQYNFSKNKINSEDRACCPHKQGLQKCKAIINNSPICDRNLQLSFNNVPNCEGVRNVKRGDQMKSGENNRVRNNITGDLSSDENACCDRLTCNVQRKCSKILQSENVKEFFKNAKEYLTFRKHSAISLSSDVCHPTVANGIMHNTIQYTTRRGRSNGCYERKFSESMQRGIDNSYEKTCLMNNLNKTETNRYSHLENIDQKNDSEGKLLGDSVLLSEPTDMSHKKDKVKNSNKTKNGQNKSVESSSELLTPHLVTNPLARRKSSEDKYRLYGNTPTKNLCSQIYKNQSKILQSDSECENYYDEPNCYSDSQSENEKAKNWLTKKIKNKLINNKISDECTENHNSLSDDKIKSIHNTLAEEDEVCQINNYNNKEHKINLTMALNRIDLLTDSEKFEQLSRFNPNRRHKTDLPNSKRALNETNSFKNNYNKIKLMKKNLPYKQNKIVISGLKNKKSNHFSYLSKGYSSSTSTIKITNKKYNNIKRRKLTVRDTRNLKSRKIRSNSSRSEYILNKNRPKGWYKVITRNRGNLLQRSDETSKTETENTRDSESVSDKAKNIVEGSSNFSKYSLDQMTESSCNKLIETTEYSTKHFVQTSIVSDYKETSTTVSSETRELYQFTNTSSATLSLDCFQDPILDPKTGFCPLLPT